MSVDSNTTEVFGSVDLSERLPSLIASLGTALGIVLVAEGVLVATQGLAIPNGYVAGVVSSLLIIGGLVFGGFWIRDSHISPDRYGRIGLWCLTGMVVFTVFISAVTIASGQTTVMAVVSTIRWGASVGAGLGLLIGVMDARAVQQAFQAGLVRQRELETREERDRLDEFASVLSHDLRNPLSVAQGRLELVAEECDSEHIDSVVQSHERMETLIEDVLSLARAGDAIGETSPVAISDAAEAAWQNVESPSARLVSEAEHTVPADVSRLQQLLENLFRNAIEHGGEGVTITVGDLPDGFYVEDDGTGIPEPEREKILDPGYSTSDTGTGFGLSIVRDIAAAHGWEVTVTSGSDGGARFEFTEVQNG